jgi:hypothetical protein
MTINLPKPEIIVTKEQEEKDYFNLLKYDSHKWIEYTNNYYQCEYCKIFHTAMMAINEKSLCKENPHLK